jgi:hypothetical protein
MARDFMVGWESGVDLLGCCIDCEKVKGGVGRVMYERAEDVLWARS